MHISKRLREIANLIEPNDLFVYDVGCDHALLDIYLAQKFKKIKFLAIDISAKCINKSKENIESFKLENRIDTLVNDGLIGVDLMPNSTIVISGMGAHTIVDILSKTNLVNCKKIIIQSNNDLEYLRRQMVKKHFKIQNELVVFDKKYYVTMVFVPGIEKYNASDYRFGTKLLCDNKANQGYFKWLYDKEKKLLTKIPYFKFKKRWQIKKDLHGLKKVIH